jgi:hypothetical protein
LPLLSLLEDAEDREALSKATKVDEEEVDAKSVEQAKEAAAKA